MPHTFLFAQKEKRFARQGINNHELRKGGSRKGDKKETEITKSYLRYFLMIPKPAKITEVCLNYTHGQKPVLKCP